MTAWVPFDRAEIARRVSTGEVVFVDVTADWCLTCKANKALVLDRDPVVSALAAEGVTPMQADWTRVTGATQAIFLRYFSLTPKCPELDLKVVAAQARTSTTTRMSWCWFRSPRSCRSSS